MASPETHSVSFKTSIASLTAKAPAKAAAAPAQPAAPAVGPELIELKKDTDNWTAVVKYVTDNKDKGVEAIGKQLVRKYKISPALKKEIANLIQS